MFETKAQYADLPGDFGLPLKILERGLMQLIAE